MAIKTSTFSGWRLSGKDADAFLKQLKNATPNPNAKAAIANGRPLAEEFLAKGHVVFGSQKNPSLKKS
ncbi:hypothetical protein PSM96_12425 [Legionella pneumophila]|uniref:hypothetical protein n=1 Tax=Legionella pneumophila TaxID=446 RepID=UPI002222C9DD|nr:hypothetical protein [Legionella pneumophila]MDO5215739.1 hypothetical protein [Legionella pneumophila]